MTTCATYIGFLDDPKFSWEGGNEYGNVPTPQSPEFPPTGKHYNTEFHDWVKLSGVEWKQTDFGGWVAIVNRQQILAFIEFCYGPHPEHADPEQTLQWEGRAYLIDRLSALREFVSGLSDDLRYALVATEY